MSHRSVYTAWLILAGKKIKKRLNFLINHDIIKSRKGTAHLGSSAKAYNCLILLATAFFIISVYFLFGPTSLAFRHNYTSEIINLLFKYNIPTRFFLDVIPGVMNSSPFNSDAISSINWVVAFLINSEFGWSPFS